MKPIPKFDVVEDAVAEVCRRFPVPGYMDHRQQVLRSVASISLLHLSAGARVLDFGSGPCDIAATCALLGFESFACDDLLDPWHQRDGAVSDILEFAAQHNVRFKQISGDRVPFEGLEFDMVMLHAVLEHLHDSPRWLLTELVARLKVGGLLYVTVPNAVNIRKRIAVVRGRTNLPPYQDFYWAEGPWRGHVREYVKNDLLLLASNLDLEIVSLHGTHHMLHKVPERVQPLYRALTYPFPGWRDSWSLLARKRSDWQPAFDARVTNVSTGPRVSPT